MAPKEYKTGNDENRSTYCSCKKEYVKLLKEKKQGWQEKKSE
jgi:hypothetical protein